MRNKVWTKWILIVIPAFSFLMKGCASTRLQPRAAAPGAHFLFLEPNHMQIGDFLHLDTGQSLYRSTAAWKLPDLGDVHTRSFRDVQKEFEQLDWEVNQLINSLSDMIHQIDSHQKGRLQINRTKLETIHDTIRDKGEVWISSKGGNTLSGKGFERTGGACNDLLELFENFGNPDRYHPREGEGTSSTEHSSSTTTPSPNAYSEDLQPTPSISADTKNTGHVDFQAVVSIYGSDTYFTPSLSSDFNMQGSMTTFGLSKDLSPTQTPRSPELDDTFSHVDVSSGSQISVGATPLLVSKSFSNTTRPSVEVASSAGVTVLLTTVTPVLNSASAFSTLRASSTEGGVTVSSGNLIGHQSSWNVLESSIEQSDIHGGSSVQFPSVLMPSSSFSDVAKLSTISISSYQPFVGDPAKSSLITSSSFDDRTRTSSLLPSYTVPTGSKMDTPVDSPHSASMGDINSVLSSWDDVSSSQAAKSFWMLTLLFRGVTQPIATLFFSDEASTQTALHISADSSSSPSTSGAEGSTWNSRQGDSSQMATQMQSKSGSDNSNTRTPFYTLLPGETQIRNSLTSSWVGSSSRLASSSATQETLEQTSVNASLLFTAGAETNFAPQTSSITPSGVNTASYSSLPASGTAGTMLNFQGISQVSFTGMDMATRTARSDIPSSAVQITPSTRLTDVLATLPPSFTSATTVRSSVDATTSEPPMPPFRSNVSSLASSTYKSVIPALSESIAPLAASTSSLTGPYGTPSTNDPPSCSDGRTTCGLSSVETLATRGMGTLSTSPLLASSSPPSSSSVTQQRATATAPGTSQHATSSASISESTTRNFETTPKGSSIPSPSQSRQGASKGARTVGSQFLFVLVLAVRLV